ncbi:MAG: hypothetical protein H6741_35275, partial [Alphaproteobacteria bacterium]|nr:hypothetical protein [Alphaproteobacteria bacterium]
MRSSTLALLMLGSGAAALTYEVLWMRRFALLLGGGAVAVTLTVATLFGGLGLGGLLGGRLRATIPPTRVYALLEGSAALWVLAFPFALSAVTPWVRSTPGLSAQALCVAALAGPPALALGATLPTLARAVPDRAEVTTLYAANTTGAVLGTLAVPGLLLPLFGVSGAERVAAGLGLVVATLAWRLEGAEAPVETEAPTRGWGAPALAVGLSGLCAMSLEISWTRLGAVLLGPSVHAFAWVLAVFLGGVAVGAAWGRRGGRIDRGLGAMGLAAILGAALYGRAPLWLASLYDALGPGAMG